MTQKQKKLKKNGEEKKKLGFKTNMSFETILSRKFRPLYFDQKFYINSPLWVVKLCNSFVLLKTTYLESFKTSFSRI